MELGRLACPAVAFGEGGCLELSLCASVANRPSLNLTPLTPTFSEMKSVAVIGASNDRTKFGNKAVRAYLQRGYTVYPVNPKETEIEGLPAFAGIRAIPARPQLVSVYVPSSVLLKILPDIAAIGCDELWLNPGTESDDVLLKAESLGLNIIQACSIVSLGVSPYNL
jgi:predicted CoA-binding protein